MEAVNSGCLRETHCFKVHSCFSGSSGALTLSKFLRQTYSHVNPRKSKQTLISP